MNYLKVETVLNNIKNKVKQRKSETDKTKAE